MMLIRPIIILPVIFFHCVLAIAYPIEVGSLTTHRYNAGGDVTILDEKRIKISDMTYNGRGPRTFFMVGSDLPIHSNNGETIPYSDTCISDGTQFNCDIGIPKMGLGGVPKREVIITLPGDLTISDIKWLSLYCIKFKVNFGDIMLDTVTVPETPAPIPVCKNELRNTRCNRMKRRCKKNEQVMNNCNLSCNVCCGNIMKDMVCEKRKSKCNTKLMTQMCRKTCNICSVTE